MKRLFTLFLSIAMMFTLSLPIFAQSEDPNFEYAEYFEAYSFWSYEELGYWHYGTLSITNLDEDNLQVSYYTSDDVDTGWVAYDFKGLILKSEFNYHKGKDLIMQISIAGNYKHSIYEYGLGFSEENYAGDLKLDLVWDFVLEDSYYNNLHNESNYLGKYLTKNKSLVDVYELTGTLNEFVMAESNYAYISNYSSKSTIIDYDVVSELVNAQNQSLQEDFFELYHYWTAFPEGEFLPVYHNLIINFVRNESENANFVHTKVMYVDNYINSIKTIFEANFDPTLLDFPKKNDPSMALMINLSGTETVYFLNDNWDWEIVSTETKTLTVDLAWNYTEWESSRSNTIYHGPEMTYHISHLNNTFYGTCEGSLGALIIEDAEAQLSTHETRPVTLKQD